jgi:hypothetical protein
MSGFDLASILADSANGAAQFEALAVTTTENAAAQNDITNLMVSQARTAQTAAEEIAVTQGKAKLETQRTNLKVANTMGTNAADTGWLIGKMGERVIAADAAAQEKLKTITAKQSISFIDNPIGYLYAQATLDADIGEYNGNVRASELAKDTAGKLESMSQQSFLTQNAIEQSVTEGVIASNAILQGYKYSNDANQAALQGLRTNLEGITKATQASAEAVNMKFRGFSADMQNKSYQISLANLDLSRKNFDLAAEAKKAKMDEDSLVGKFVAKGYFNMSGNTLDPVRAKEMIALYKAGQPEIRELFNSGMQSYMIDPSGKQSVISTSPYDAATAFGSGMVQNLPQAQKDVGDWLVQKRREFQNPAIQNKLAIDPKDKTGQERAFNEYIRGQANIEGRSGVGIYTPAALTTVAKANANLAELPVWKAVLAPMAAAGNKLDDPNVVFGAVLSAVQKGTLQYNDALAITTMYRSGVDINNMSRNWIATGLPMGTGYVARVNTYGVMGKTPVDLTNETAVATMLNKAAASTAAISMRKQVFQNLPGAGVN